MRFYYTGLTLVSLAVFSSGCRAIFPQGSTITPTSGQASGSTPGSGSGSMAAPILNQPSNLVFPNTAVTAGIAITPIQFTNTNSLSTAAVTFTCMYDQKLDQSFGTPCSSLSGFSFVGGLFSWTPSATQAWGPYEFQITATNAGGTASTTFTIDVRQNYPITNLQADLDADFSTLISNAVGTIAGAASAGSTISNWINLASSSSPGNLTQAGNGGGLWAYTPGYQWSGSGTVSNPYALGFSSTAPVQNYIQLPNYTGAGKFMLSLWINPSSSPANSILMSTGGELGQGFVLRHNATNPQQLEFLIGGNTAQSYSATTQALQPDVYWELNDNTPSTSTAAAASVSGFTGTYSSGLAVLKQADRYAENAINTQNLAPGLVSPTNLTSTIFDGKAQYAASLNQLASQKFQGSLNTFSIEAWFKTPYAGYTGSGVIVGYANSNGPLSNIDAYDRNIYMTSGGTIVFGVWETYGPGTGTGQQHVVYSAPNIFNDGNWHHVVATVSSTPTGTGSQTSVTLSLYLDYSGTAATPVQDPLHFISKTSTFMMGLENYPGYWRVGGGQIGGWFGHSATPSNFFQGSIDDVAIYPGALLSARVSAHYTASTGSYAASLNLPPVQAKTNYINAVTQDRPLMVWNISNYIGTPSAANIPGRFFVSGVTGLMAGYPLPAYETTDLPFRNPSPSIYTGTYQQAVSFSGSPQQPQFIYQVDQTSSYVQPYSIEFWVKASSQQLAKITGFENTQLTVPTQSAQGVYVNGSGNLVFSTPLVGGSSAAATGGTNIFNNQWNHVVAQFTGNSLVIYVNGKLDGSSLPISPSSIPPAFNGYWKLGGGATPSSLGSTPITFFNGLIDYFAVYDKALSAQDISNHYISWNAPTVDTYLNYVFTDSPVLMWHFMKDTPGIQGGLVNSYDPSGQLFLEPTTSLISTPSKAGGPDGLAGQTSTGSEELITTQYKAKASSYENNHAFTTQTWFNTTTTTGGKIFGFETSNNGLSMNYDRHLYMTTAGHLIFGVQDVNGNKFTISPSGTAASKSYNDGMWHFVTVTYTGPNVSPANTLTLYVDGQPMNTITIPNNLFDYYGYWTVGGGRLSPYDGWLNAPILSYFNGSVKDFAVYPGVLTATEVNNQFFAGNSPCVLTDLLKVDGSTWYNVGVLFDGNVGSVYLSGTNANGQLLNFKNECSAVFGNTLGSTLLPISVGSDIAGVHPWSGQIGDVKIYSTGDPTTLQQIFTGTKSRFGY